MTRSVRSWSVLGSRCLLERPWLQIHEQRVRLATGREIEAFHLIDAPDWVAVLPLTSAGEVVMVDQYRHGARRVSRELPAGVIDSGETPLDAAQRELSEETGYAAREWRLIELVQTEPSRHTNRAHFFLALGAERASEPRAQDDEDIEVVLVPVAELIDAVEQGGICHGLHVGAILLAERRGWLTGLTCYAPGVDPDIKQRFDTLEGAMARLADGLRETNVNMAQGFARLTEAQVRTDERVGTLAEGLSTLAEGLSTLTERVDLLAQLMIRGHTEAAERHATVIDRLDKLEGE